MNERVTQTWKIGEYTFSEVINHAFTADHPGPMYFYVIEGDTKGIREYYPTLDHALVAAVGQKYTGHRGAGGSGVDTAAGWFMRMIGADRD